MLWSPRPAFTKYQTNANLPIQASGIAVTPGANDVKGSWTDLLSGTVNVDTYGICIHMHGNASSAQARPTLVDIGVDPAGGTAYTVLIPNLNACSAQGFGSSSFLSRGIQYYFPLFIKAGSRLAGRAQVGNATAGDVRTSLRLYQGLSDPEMYPFGTFVEAIGIDLANSRGTAITPVLQPTEGTWTVIGSTVRNVWWFQQSMSIDNAAMGGGSHYIDLGVGDGTNMRMVIENQEIHEETSESINSPLRNGPECICPAPAGTSVRMRVMAAGTITSNYTAMVHALG